MRHQDSQIGMKVMKGEVRNGLINLSVTGPSDGIGVDLTGVVGNKAVYDNQFTQVDSNDDIINNQRGFHLALHGISQNNGVKVKLTPNDFSMNDINAVYY